MKKETKIIRLTSLYALPTQQLEQLLRQELDGRRDRQTVLQIVSILKERDTASAQGAQPPAQESGETFHTALPSKKRIILLRVAAIAAVLALLLTIVPPVLGAENIFQLIGSWTQDIFSFLTPECTEDRSGERHFETDHPGLQKLYDTVTQYGATAPVVPTWLPEGFELESVDIFPQKQSTKVTAYFMHGEYYIIVCCEVYKDSAANAYPKDNIDVEMVEQGGIKHYIVCNDGKWIATWGVDNAECALVTNFGKETLSALIVSIYSEVK